MKVKIEMTVIETYEVIKSGALLRLVSSVRDLQQTAKTEVSKAARKAAKTEESDKMKIAKEAEADPEPASAEKSTAKVTKVELREILGQKAKAEGKRDKVKALFAEFGATKLPEVKEEDWQELYKKAQAL